MTPAILNDRLLGAALGLLSLLATQAVPAAQLPPPLQPDVSDTATLPPPGPHRFFTANPDKATFVIFDADTGRMEGSFPSGREGMLALAPDDSLFYVLETFWSHGTRGTRQDLVTAFDSKTLNVVNEVVLPGRAMEDDKVQNFTLNASGTRAYVYVMHPAASVVWVDLKQHTVGGTVEIPGCALVFPWGEDGFSSLCGDGSLAVVSVPSAGTPKVSHTKPFFDANNDPIYENSFVDRATGRALFLSYTGLVYEAQLGANTTVSKPWSIQKAGGFPVAGTGVQELAWRPGGTQMAAYHRASGKLFVLMHAGNYWTHKQGGTEVWVLDTKTHTLISRFQLQPVATGGMANEREPYYENIGVSQDDKPLLYLLNPDGSDLVLDATTGAKLRKIEIAAGLVVSVPGY